MPQPFKKLVHLTLAAVFSTSGAPFTAASESPRGSQASITIQMPRMQPAIKCVAHKDCYETAIPAPAGSDGMSVFTYRRTGTASDSGGTVYSDSLERRGPAAGTTAEIVNAAVYREDEGSSGSPPVRMVYSFGGNGGIGEFMRQHGQGIRAGSEGAFNYLQREQAAQARQAEAAVQIDHAYRQGRAVDGNYVRATKHEIANLNQNSARDESYGWLRAGLLAGRTGDSQNLAAFAQFQAMAQDPFTVRSYAQNSQAQAESAAVIRDQLKAGNYRRAAAEFEVLQYGSQIPPADLQRLQNDSGVLAFENYDSTLPAGPLSDARLKTQKNSDWGQIVRRMANQYQGAWAESRGMENWSDQSKLQYLAGLTYLNSADLDLAEGRAIGAVNLRIADIFLQGSLGLIHGVADGVVELVKIAPELADMMERFSKDLLLNPHAMRDAVVRVVENLPAMKDAIWSAAAQAWSTLEGGSAYDRGRLAGRLAFEAGIIYVTGGAAAVGNGATKSAQAVTTAVRSIRSFTEGAITRSATLEIAVKEIAQMPSGLRKTLLVTGLKDGARMRQGFGLYRDALASGYRDAAAITQTALKSSSEGAADFVRTAVRSQADPANSSRYLKTANDAERIVVKYEIVEAGSKAEVGRSIQGFQARAGSKAVFADNPSSVMGRHPGNIDASGRVAMKGQFGQSVGFAQDAADAGETALKELVSYGVNRQDLIYYAEQFTAAKVLDATDVGVLRRLGLNEAELILNRDVVDGAFESTHILGHVAQRQGFSGVLLKSAVDNQRTVFHWLR